MDILRNRSFGLFGALLLVLSCASHVAAQKENTCLDCHSALEAPFQVTAERFAQDIHSQKGLTCASCHGGDPTKPDETAMSKAAGFKGKTERKDVPALCGHCHSDAAYMRQYSPSLRTDQYSQYLTSMHGKLRAKGDDKVAVCTDCHSLHDIRPPNDPRSSVYPLNVATTCARCHADAAYMKAYSIPTDQFASYNASVHHEALVARGDLSAPTCTTCHGDHGAAPPGVSTVQNVCATCHVFQAQFFDASPHKAAFQAASLPGCVTCHSNHRVVQPTDAMLGTGTQSLCVRCHTAGDDGYKAAEQIRADLEKLQTAITSSDQILERARAAGMEVSQALNEEDQARDTLTKARVTVHSLSPVQVDQNVSAGLKVTQKTQAAGVAALAERDYRRKGLALSLLAIVAVVIGLRLFLRQIEPRQGPS
jgi:predicted CXXCH cytochrome family protein